VDAGVDDLIRARTSGPLPPSLAFGVRRVEGYKQHDS
jgi:hypothetical protein